MAKKRLSVKDVFETKKYGKPTKKSTSSFFGGGYSSEQLRKRLRIP